MSIIALGGKVEQSIIFYDAKPKARNAKYPVQTYTTSTPRIMSGSTERKITTHS